MAFPWQELKKHCQDLLDNVSTAKSFIAIRDQFRGIEIGLDQRKIASILLEMCNEYEEMKKKAYPFKEPVNED